MPWQDFFKLFSFATEEDPLAKRKDHKHFPSAGVSQPDALMPNSGQSSFREASDMIDTTTLTNRPMRYKEYERLRNVPEIEMSMQVFADEACVAGNTRIATPFGYFTIKELTEKKADDRFLVYSYDFKKKDYTLAWAYAPRIVKEEETITIVLENGTEYTATADHKVLKADGTWTTTGELKCGEYLMPFYRQSVNHNFIKYRHNQYARIFSFEKGWIHEKQFLEDWKTGKTAPEYLEANKVIRALGAGLTLDAIEKLVKHEFATIKSYLEREGFSAKEVRWLYRRHPTKMRILGVHKNDKKQPVYDISVEEHKCFATDSVILHNCQKDENGDIFKINVENDEVKEELEFVLLHRKMLNLNRNGLTWFKNLCIFGDWFVELVVNPDSPKDGIFKAVPLPPETMFRIESIKGKLLEFQQSKEGPDYQALLKNQDPLQQDDNELKQTTAIRFAPQQIIHFKIGDDRKTFYPYGQSLIEPARGPAHSLKMMEDAMLVYRLCIRGYDKISIVGGWKYMKDITMDDVIYTYNQSTKALEEGKICWKGLIEKKKVFKVKSKHTSVTGTDAHPILIFDENKQSIRYVKIKNLIPGQHYFLRPLLNYFEPKKINRYYKSLQAVLTKEQTELYKNSNYLNKNKIIEKSLEKFGITPSKKTTQKCWSFLNRNLSVPYEFGKILCEGFDLGEPICKNKGEKMPERINLPAYVDEDFAMLFGFLIGDGCINWNKGSAKLLFAAGEYPKLNEKYSSSLVKYFGKCRFQQDKRIGKGLGMYCTNSSTACEILENMGYIGNAHTKRIPGWVFKERPEIRKAFIKGLADAEGEKRGMSMDHWRTTIRLCNKELVEDIKQIWESLGLHASEAKQINEPERWIKETYVPAGISWEVYICEKEVPFYDKIISIQPAGEEDVYDLTVEHPTEHNFLCNGVPISNSRAPERRVFYIDVGQLPPFKAEAFVDRLKDQFRKRKIASNRGVGANGVEEKWQAPAQDEDYWLPMRPNSNTRIDTLPGAENLGEIDDAVYFRNKLLTALNFPKNYFNNEDPGATRITLSSQDVKFARMIERLQSHFEDGILELAERHLQLRGFPEDSYQDLRIKMTPPSDWRELSRTEVITARYGNAGTLKSGQLMSDYDIYIDIFKYSTDEAEEKLARLKLQKLEDLKLQVLAQNPALLGVGIPGQDATSPELGAEPGGPNAMPAPDGSQPPENTPETPPAENTPSGPPSQTPAEGANIPEPSEDDIKKYDLELQNYEREMDTPNIDYSIPDEGI